MPVPLFLNEEETMLFITIAVLIVINGFLSAYTTRFQETTLWAGQKITPPDVLEVKPRGYQDAITPGS